MEIEGPNGQRMAMVKKALITPLHDRWVVKIGDGPDLEVQGNLLDHEYTIGEGQRQDRRSLQKMVPRRRQLWRADRAGAE